MTIPLHRRGFNIRRSLLYYVHANFTVPQGVTGKVNEGSSEFSAKALDEWVDIQFLSETAGKRGEAMVQFDVYTRVSSSGGDDKHATRCEALADALYEALHVDTVQLLDFTADASSPTPLTSRRLAVQRSDGTFREPESARSWPVEDGVARRTLTYRFVLPDDYAGNRNYDD